MGTPGYTPVRESEDILGRLLDGLARLLFWLGLLCTVVSLGFLLYTFFVFAGGGQANPAQAQTNIEIFKKVLLGGVLGLGVGSTFLFWGEETMAPLQLIGAAALFFTPFYLPTMAGATTLSDVSGSALSAIQMGGMVGGAVALVAIVADVLTRVKLRVRHGSKADQLKYGKGVKEERDIQNVFMGKCWQLPFCRKFVRDKCPIYHSRRTCWKERVGCMCEESVIQNAMAGKTIPKDMVAAAKFIPYNSKLTPNQKIERCRHCVIYNEHQKHKYKLAMPVILVGVAALYILGREPLKVMLGNLLNKVDRLIGTATYRAQTEEKLRSIDTAGLVAFKEILLFCLMLVVLAYLMKLAEYLFFKAKI